MTLRPLNSERAKADAYLGEITVRRDKYDRMNYWSVAEHFNKHPLRLPQMNNPYTGRRLEPTLF